MVFITTGMGQGNGHPHRCGGDPSVPVRRPQAHADRR
jgi:hypothetical protein